MVRLVDKINPKANLFVVYKNAFDSQSCDKLKQFCDHLQPEAATVYTEDNTHKKDNFYRECYTVFIENEKEAEPLSEYCLQFVHQAISQANWNFDVINKQYKMQYTVYEQGHFYKWHTDNHHYLEDDIKIDNDVDLDISSRLISFVILLSDLDDFEGGDLEFRHNGVITNMKDSMKKGTMIIFPSFIEHRVVPVEAGIRKTLVGWVAGNIKDE